EEDRVEPGLYLPNSVVNGCETSFKATNKNHEKASTMAFASTGLMAAICCHDRVLWMVNMTTVGEKQYYAVALLSSLFEELPSWWRLGVLYDIACVLHRSMSKWKILPSLLPRIDWGISVFHAFGHQWPCQCMYHPQKCKGFGFSDGEGCERCWGALKKLAPVLQVSGHHQRLFVLSTQVIHWDEATAQSQATWLMKHYVCTMVRLEAARERIGECGLSIPTLQAGWRDQLETQSKPLPVVAKNLAGSFVNKIVSMLATHADEEAGHKNLLKEISKLGEDRTSADVKFDLTLQAQNWQDYLNRLATRIQRACQQLVQKDQPTYSALEKARKDKFLGLQLYSKISPTVYSDHKAHAQTAEALKRQLPGIKALARCYNGFCAQLSDMKAQSPIHKNAVIPKPVDINDLFDIGVDDAIWDDAGLDGDVEETPPAWLADEKTREGIKAMLMYDWGKEEIGQLNIEMQALFASLTEQYLAIEKAV
ncbi:hypothetical protein BS47DRAFT_1257332, partial [Hydnum rufescens UP504]